MKNPDHLGHYSAVVASEISRRNLLRISLAGGAFLAAGSLFGGVSAAENGTLTIGADADPIGLDPVTVTAFSSYDFLALMYSGLLRWTADMQIEPDLAVSYEQPDDVTYVFKLRDGVKFHNGKPFSAEDVKYTFDRILAPESKSRLRAQYSGIKAVDVVDPSTVRFELTAPDAAFLNYLATNPDGVISAKGVDNLDAQPVGTGPFMFESYEPNQEFVLKANPDYYEPGLPKVAKVVFKFFKDQATITSALRSKAVDMTWLKDPRVAAQIAKSSPDLVSAPGQTSRTFPVWLNVKTAPFNDVRVRRALSLATDRNACVQTVLGGSGKVGAVIPESQVGGFNGEGDMPYYEHNPETARQLLAEAGFPNGIDIGEYLLVAANPLDVACAQIMQQQWAAAGITVKLTPMETAPLLEMWNSGTYPTLLSVALSWTPDSDAILQRFKSTSDFGKAQGFSDTGLDAMIDEARTILDNEARAAKVGKIQRYIADNAFVLEIYQYPLRWELWWNYVEGYEPMAANTRSFVRQTAVNK